MPTIERTGGAPEEAPKLTTEEHIELSANTLAEVYAHLSAHGNTFAGAKEAAWIAKHPDANEANRYKDGAEYFFFGSGNGYYADRLVWDEARQKFSRDTVNFNNMGSEPVWGSTREKAGGKPRRVVFHA